MSGLYWTTQNTHTTCLDELPCMKNCAVRLSHLRKPFSPPAVLHRRGDASKSGHYFWKHQDVLVAKKAGVSAKVSAPSRALSQEKCEPTHNKSASRRTTHMLWVNMWAARCESARTKDRESTGHELFCHWCSEITNLIEPDKLVTDINCKFSTYNQLFRFLRGHFRRFETAAW